MSIKNEIEDQKYYLSKLRKYYYYNGDMRHYMRSKILNEYSYKLELLLAEQIRDTISVIKRLKQNMDE